LLGITATAFALADLLRGPHGVTRRLHDFGRNRHEHHAVTLAGNALQVGQVGCVVSLGLAAPSLGGVTAGGKSAFCEQCLLGGSLTRASAELTV
jgi:hypothetical protein